MAKLASAEVVTQAFDVVREFNRRQYELGDDLRRDARQAVKEVLEGRMQDCISEFLEYMDSQGLDDRRNGCYERHLLSSLGDLELEVPRTRRWGAARVLGRYVRRSKEIDQVVLSSFILGLSTRKVGEALLPLLGEKVSATVVSQIAKCLDGAVLGFHRRPLRSAYRALLFDGVVLSRKTGAGAVRRPVLVALGLLPDGRKEVIDFVVAESESENAWTQFLTDLAGRGLVAVQVEIISIDGNSGLRAAIDTVFPGVPVQRCWAHKARNIADKVRKTDQPAVRRDIRRIYNAPNIVEARSAARRFAQRWGNIYPKAVACLRNDLDELLTFYRFKEPEWQKAVRTTNAIERRFREVKRRTRPMGVFSDRTSIERILFAVFNHENRGQRVGTLFLLTHNS